MTAIDDLSTAARERRIPGAAVFGDAFAHLLGAEPASATPPVVSETFERHRASFARTWPEPEDDGEEYRLPPTPPKTARRVELEDLGDGKSKRVQAAKAAADGRWSWTAQHAVSPTDPEVESIVMRFRLPGTMPWDCRRVVAYWRATWKTVKGARTKPYAFVCAYAWREYGGQVLGERQVVAAKDLAAYLREPPALEPQRRPPPRRRSNLDLSARW